MNDDFYPQDTARGHLMALAIEWLAKWSGHDAAPLLAGLPAPDGERLAEYRKLLGTSATSPGAPLLSIFSRVQDPDGHGPPPQKYWPAQSLTLDPVEPGDARQARQADLTALWNAFAGDARKVLALPAGGDDPRFEAFTHLLHKWAWAVPCSYGEPGVSLYDEFRALSAMVHASGCAVKAAGQFLLVGGDIPGIQKTIYTITSKGAVKGLRGRSFFIQLLGDAVVQRLLADLELPETNVIYAAGGNFMLLAQAGSEPQVDEIAQAIDRELLKAFEGDLALCLACLPLPAVQVGRQGFQAASRRLHQELGRQKRRRFAGLAEGDWESVFAAQGQRGVPFCGVCQHERRPGERGRPLEDGGWKCDQCHGFEELAQAIAQVPLLMFVSGHRSTAPAEAWQELLWELTRRWYAFGPDLKQDMPPGARVYSVNGLDYLGESAHGFRMIANTTPRGNDGQVQTFEDLANGAVGLKRVGVLRMDVDDLGRVLTQWMPGSTLATTSALSHAIDRFFTGWLDAICLEVMAEPPMAGKPKDRSGLLYVIYAGGDDLFVVGAWDLMPLLAERIQRRFTAYVGGNPRLHISAGITLEDRKFPLYQAADRAGSALENGAKEWTRMVEGEEVKKNALSFLNKAVGWEEGAFPFVEALARQLIRLVTKQGVPHSLLTTMRAIHDRYYADVQRAQKRGLEGAPIHYGPWMWLKAYQLARTRRGYAETSEVATAIKQLEKDVLTKERMPYVGLATRWAEYLMRGGKEE